MDRSRTFRRTRIAPTPSGYLHLGNILSFVLTAGLARRHGAEICLRIDDLDRARVRRAYIDDIFDTLRFLSIPWDLGPRDGDEFLTRDTQMLRMDLYLDALRHLQEQGAVFACNCSRSVLSSMSQGGGYPGTCRHKGIPLSEEGHAWRLHTAQEAEVVMHRLTGLPTAHALPPDMRCMQVRRRDGSPAYQLASVVDDIHFGVDLVVRGADLHDPTLGQLHLSRLLPSNGFAQTVFCHHRLLTDTTGGKLSKSEGAMSVRHMRQTGHTARDVYAQIARSLGSDERPDSWAGLFEWLSAEAVNVWAED